jgi:beta-N-acetylhexosaminidase
MVLSDSMNMGAIRRHYDPAEAAVKAILAGVDMIMLAEEHYDHDAARYLDEQVFMIQGIVDAVRRGRLPEGRVEEAVQRIVSLKKRVPARAGDLSSVGGASHRAVETEASERAVCLAWDRGGFLPLAKGRRVAVVNATTRASYAILTRTRGIGPNQAEPAFEAFSRELRERLLGVSLIEADKLLSGGPIPAEVQTADVVVAALEDYTLPEVSFDRQSHAKVLQQLRPLGSRVVLAALCDPYVLRGGQEFAAAVCTCSSRTSAAVAAARAICGIIPFKGRLPVRI